MDWTSWSVKSVYNRLVIKCIWLRRCLKVEYNDPHKFASKLHGFSFTLLTTRSAIMGVKNLTPIWPTVLVDEVKGKPCNFEACLCGSLYSTFITSFYPYAFYNTRLQTIFKDQLDRSKATCSFKCNVSFDKFAFSHVLLSCCLICNITFVHCLLITLLYP